MEEEEGEKGRVGEGETGRGGDGETGLPGEMLGPSELSESAVTEEPVSPSPPLPLSLSPPRQSRGRSAMEITGGLALILVVMGWIQFGGPAILDNDGYYHIRWAAMLRGVLAALKARILWPLSKTVTGRAR